MPAGNHPAEKPVCPVAVEELYARRDSHTDAIRLDKKRQRNAVALFLGQHRGLRTSRTSPRYTQCNGTDTGYTAPGNRHLFGISGDQSRAFSAQVAPRKFSERYIHSRARLASKRGKRKTKPISRRACIQVN